VLREVDQKDLVVAMKGASEAVIERLVAGMSPRVRTFIIEEIEYLGPMPQEEINSVQDRIVMQVRQLAGDGVIDWPPGRDTPPPQALPEPDLEPELDNIGRPLDALRIDEIRMVVQALSVRAQAHGILSLETAANAAGDGFVSEGLRLAVDGASPDLLEDFLKTRGNALLQHLDNRLQIVVEAMACICGGDNPRMVAHKLLCVYRADYDTVVEPTGGTLDELMARLQAQPASGWDLDTLVAWLTDLSVVARRGGLAALRPLVDCLDEPALRQGVELLATRASMEEIVEALYGHKSAALIEKRSRLAVFTAGITAVQRAHKGADLDAAMDESLQQVEGT
jgi:flagellar motor component MotA